MSNNVVIQAVTLEFAILLNITSGVISWIINKEKVMISKPFCIFYFRTFLCEVYVIGLGLRNDCLYYSNIFMKNFIGHRCSKKDKIGQ